MKPRALDSLPQVDTDGECLILRRVLINGRPHDLRVWKYDEEGNSSAFGEVLKETILKTATLSQEIFSKHVAVGQRITYADKPEEGCFFDDRNIDLNSPAALLMKEIHRGFFREEKTIWSKNGENPFVSLTHLPKEAPPVISQPSSIEEIEEPVSPPPSPRVPPAPPPVAPAAAAPEEDFLEGIDYDQLVSYSKKPTEDPKLEKVYKAYQKLLENPSQREEDEDELFQRVLLPAYRHWAHKLADRKDLWEKRPAEEQPLNTLETWSKEMGARVMLQHIVVNQSIDSLVDEIKQFPIIST